jgi:hypothetical protein
LIPILVERCERALRSGTPSAEIRDRVLPGEIEKVMKQIAAKALLELVKEHREYSSYYYDAQQDGVCAKPRELVAAILESIVLDALEIPAC